MKEISPKELQKLNDKSFKDTQKIFRRRLREIADDGNKEATYKPDEYCMGDHIKSWLESLGFIVKQIGPSWCKITWPEEKDIYEKLRSEDEALQKKAEKAHWDWLCSSARLNRQTPGTWTFDPHPYDYVCSECGKHAEYTTPYCPNCGKKMKPLEGRKNDS
jgi:hypothetical protein